MFSTGLYYHLKSDSHWIGSWLIQWKRELGKFYCFLTVITYGVALSDQMNCNCTLLVISFTFEKDHEKFRKTRKKGIQKKIRLTE